MASFTIEKALNCKILNSANILCGEKGVSREISRITVGEVPDLPKWLHGGELILSTLYAFKDDKSLLESFIKGLIDSNASGLCLKTTRFLIDVDQSVIDLSNKNNFPIINIQQNIRWSDVIQSLYEVMLEEKIRFETEMRLKGDLLDELLGSGIKSDDELIKRANYLGYDISDGCVAMIIDIDSFREFIMNKTESKIQLLKEEFYTYVSNVVKPLATNSLTVQREDSLIIFFSPEKSENKMQKIESFAKNILIHCKERFENFSVSIGISRYHSRPLDIIKAYEEAVLSIKVNSKIGMPGSIIYFDHLGSYKLLLKLFETNPEEITGFYNETIAPLIEYDNKHGSELVKTLEMFLSKEQNIVDTANEMFLHRHTVRYRLSRIKEIAGLDIDHTEDRERLSLGLKALRLLKTSSTT